MILKTKSLFLSLLALLLVLTACGPSDSSKNNSRDNQPDIKTSRNSKQTEVSPSQNDDPHAILEVYSYNAGMMGLVHCYKNRQPKIIKALDRIFKAHAQNQVPFFFGLQEVWNKVDFESIKNLVEKYQFKIAPATYSHYNGLVNITNVRESSSDWTPFGDDTFFNRRGIRSTTINLDEKDMTLFNTHTTYSDRSGVDNLHLEHIEEVFQTVAESNTESHIVVGDFNAGPNIRYRNQVWDPIETLWHKGILGTIESMELKLESAFKDHPNTVTWDIKNSMTRDMFKGFNDEENAQMDHIFYTRDALASIEEEVLTFEEKGSCKTSSGDVFSYQHLSDHYGLKARIQINN